MSAATKNRRDVLRDAAVGASAIAAAGLLTPAAAIGQSADDEDLRDFLVEAIGLEQVTVLGYSTASDASGVNSELANTLDRFRDHEQAHANALRTALDSLGFDLPEPPDTATDTTVFDDVEGLSDDAAGRLTALLERLDGLDTPDALLRYLVDLETEQLRFYITNAPALESEDLSTTGAEIAGCQAEHLIALQRELGDSPEAAVKAVTQATTSGAPE